MPLRGLRILRGRTCIGILPASQTVKSRRRRSWLPKKAQAQEEGPADAAEEDRALGCPAKKPPKVPEKDVRRRKSWRGYRWLLQTTTVEAPDTLLDGLLLLIIILSEARRSWSKQAARLQRRRHRPRPQPTASAIRGCNHPGPCCIQGPPLTQLKARRWKERGPPLCFEL